ncbi:CocE/NonD family hydrolase [Saccharopolyspora hirsuta]|uniref:CocE/NonD family hydrolase n=1 Tax=Saccharopolyspora hirsuta TaxID=1837 RepID=A0A5M7C7T2_SACHI|nr:CocE/NonD family hydrolase [Saccharopolyspora hirsuta]KAA5838062.1 CocE/NonD family hydrolase [Saccharopolyspora hirsuta]
MRRRTFLAGATAAGALLAAEPAFAAGQLSDPFFRYDRPPQHGVRTERVRIPLRDGSFIAADLHRPDSPGPFPGIVYDYNAYDQLDEFGRAARDFVVRGYAVLVCNARGSGASPGELDPFSAQEQRDNHDVVEWFAAQPWCTGRIGQSGVSYGGHASLLVAVTKPPHLVAVAPVNALHDWYENTIYRGGIYSPRIRPWQEETAPETLRTYAEHPRYDDFWRERSVQHRWANLDIPVLEFNGWYDRYRDGMVKNYRARPDTVWLVSGPWAHGMPEGQHAGFDHRPFLAWWDRWLMRLPGAPLPRAKVTSYEVPGPGAGRGWQQFASWPPPDATALQLALTADGRLSEGGRPGHRSFRVNTRPGPGRPDERLVFETRPLRRDLVLAGDLEAKICASFSAPDGNIAVIVEDVAADGTAVRITQGWLKASHRHGHERLAPVEPGAEYALPVHIWPTHHRLVAGHRLRATVSSDDYPEIDCDAPPGQVNLRLGPGGSTLRATVRA